jgi:putative peptidoglycan lipid II flippase
MQTEIPPPFSGGMKKLLRPALVITVFTIGGQAIGFLTQVVIAAAFGARADMDAFLAATTLPQYVVAILVSALGFAFIPVFVDYTTSELKEDAWRVASGVITFYSLVLGVLALSGIFFAHPILRLTTPGLSPESLDLATRVATVTWPSTVAAGLVNLLASIYQAQERFGWPAAVPVIGALINLGLVIILAHPLGVLGVAIAALVSLLLQFCLLLPIAIGHNKLRMSFGWRHPGVKQVLYLLWPLVFAGLFYRSTPIIERYLASGLGVGTISHLGYAGKLLGIWALLISTGLTTVIFPRMALNFAKGQLAELRHTLSLGLRMMWLVVAPGITIGAALALPFVTAVFRRGEFNFSDARSVAGLMQIYLIALLGTCMGNITGRTFYALKNTRILAIFSAIEAVLYVIYTSLLAQWLGVTGIALGYALYFNLSLCWQFPVLRKKMGNTGGRTVAISFTRTGLAAFLGGISAWVITLFTLNVWQTFILGSVVGMIVYMLALLGTRSPEAQMIWRNVWDYIRLKRSVSIPA